MVNIYSLVIEQLSESIVNNILSNISTTLNTVMNLRGYFTQVHVQFCIFVFFVSSFLKHLPFKVLISFRFYFQKVLFLLHLYVNTS